MPNAYIKKLKQKSTGDIIYPESKTGAIYMPDNITTLDGYLGNISGSIGNTDISGIGGGTITGALSSLNQKIIDTYQTLSTTNLTWYYKKYSNHNFEGFAIWNLSTYTFNSLIATGSFIMVGGQLSIGNPYNLYQVFHNSNANFKIKGGMKFSYLGNSSRSGNIFLAQRIYSETSPNYFQLTKLGINSPMTINNVKILIEIYNGTWEENN